MYIVTIMEDLLVVFVCVFEFQASWLALYHTWAFVAFG
jgi:hypothetical protein